MNNHVLNDLGDSSFNSLRRTRELLTKIDDGLPHFSKSSIKLPIIDASRSNDQESSLVEHQRSIRGLKTLREAVKRDGEVLDKFLSQSHNSVPPSTNAPYLIALWNELSCAPKPIQSISDQFPVALGKQRDKGGGGSKCNNKKTKETFAKVDIVAQGGKSWIRVNTIKNSRLLSEFRVLDSYLTDSDSDLEFLEGQPEASQTSKIARDALDNSLLRMGRQLVSAAETCAKVHSVSTPRIVLRLTRLDPGKLHMPQLLQKGLGTTEKFHHLSDDADQFDPRIAQTIGALLDLNIEVVLGDRDFQVPISKISIPGTGELPAEGIRCTIPTSHLNCDLSILIALISDITHAPLPSSEADAIARFVPSEEEKAKLRERKMKRKIVSSHEDDDEKIGSPLQEDDGKTHGRALANQALQEMQKGLLEELADRLHVQVSPPEGIQVSNTAPVELWTTREAYIRCEKIVSKIGGPAEKRRMRALFGSIDTLPQDELDYWEGSRYPKNFIPFLPMRIYKSNPNSADTAVTMSTSQGTSFWDQLTYACQTLLKPSDTPEKVTDHLQDLDLDDEIGRAAVTTMNRHLTVHTVESLFCGLTRRCTTLTANKSSIKWVLKDMVRICAGSELLEPEGLEELDAGKANAAVIWIVQPRSLAEGFRGYGDGIP